MTTPVYQWWVLDAAWAKVAYLKRWRSIAYGQRLNNIASLTLAMHPDDPAIDDLDIAPLGVHRIRRIQGLRDGVVVFNGLIERPEWDIPQSAPTGETVTLYAVDGGKYLDWRLVVPAGASRDSRTGAADDVMKAYVRYHAGSLAAAARRFSDLTVQADSSSAPAYSAEERYEILQNVIITIANKGKVYWRMKPTTSGYTFETGYPLYGLDRTKGNGVNSECVFSLDREDFVAMHHVIDRLTMANYVYVGGQGQEELREIVERSDATSIAALLRREAFLNGSQYTLTASLQNLGDAELKKRGPIEAMTVQPTSGTWKAASGSTWDLGDKVTTYLKPDYGGGWRTFALNAVITGIDVTLSAPPDMIERAAPILEYVA
jgi:hypothetical protein